MRRRHKGDSEAVSESKEPVRTEGKSRKGRKFSICSFMNLGILFIILLLLMLVIGQENVFTYLTQEKTLLLGYRKARDISVPEHLMDIFWVYDTNRDGKLDPEEFKLLSDYIPNKKNFFSSWDPPNDSRVDEPLFESFVFEDSYAGEGNEVIVVMAEFEPLVKSTMKFVKECKTIFGRVETIMPGLYQWTTAARPVARYGAENFKAFAPPAENWGVGVPYYVVSNQSNPAVQHPILQLTPHRYHPPLPKGNEVLVHALLSQFHPNVFLGMRFEPRGTLAVVRAQNEQYYDIVIRAHAEYQLNSRPNLPFWLTPAQFSGRLIISKDFKHVAMFQLGVPTTKQLNIDMEWLTTPDGLSNQVDIGFIPKMELSSEGPSRLDTAEKGVEEKEPTWTEEITMAEAESVLEQMFYPFKQVPYLPFTEAFDLASEQQKPVHHILLWGALDDQSC